MYIETIKKVNTTGRCNTVRAELHYDIGGYSYFTHEETKRGYYLIVRPIDVSNGCESYALFSGYKVLLTEVARRSLKAEQTARNIIKDQEQWLNSLIDKVCAEELLQVVA